MFTYRFVWIHHAWTLATGIALASVTSQSRRQNAAGGSNAKSAFPLFDLSFCPMQHKHQKQVPQIDTGRETPTASPDLFLPLFALGKRKRPKHFYSLSLSPSVSLFLPLRAITEFLSGKSDGEGFQVGSDVRRTMSRPLSFLLCSTGFYCNKNHKPPPA